MSAGSKLVMNLLCAAGMAVAIAAFQFLPRTLAGSRALTALGGCGSGLCSDQKSGLCAFAGDACAGYAECAPSDQGPYICTPQQYCTSTGCGGVFNGGSCK
jgi:hypothetical protein